MRNWKPIETAPTDGTTVELWLPMLIRNTRQFEATISTDCTWEGSISDCCWDKETNRWICLDGSGADHLQSATHWLSATETVFFLW